MKIVKPFLPEGSTPCRETDPEIFYPLTEEGNESRAARYWAQGKAICRGSGDSPGCPVLFECLSYALDNDERYGIWGGTDPREREAMRSQEGIAS